MRAKAFLLIYFLSSAAIAQESPIQRIAALQAQEEGFYPLGTFPSQLVWKKGKQVVEDNNIFFTGLILYTLQSVQADLPDSAQQQVKLMYARAQQSFWRYQNRRGGITYNFYQVHPDTPFPNHPRFSKWDKMRLPDDLDDTSILALVQHPSDSLAAAFQNLMRAESYESPKVLSTFRPYRESKAFRTWFADKMRQDFDLCVMANTLLFVFQEGLLLGEVEEASIDLIADMVQADLHLHQGALVASHYQHPAIILYHLGRLVAQSSNPQLKALQAKLVSDAYALLGKAANEMERVILLSTLYRLGESPAFVLDYARLPSDIGDFYWFVANPLSGNRLWLKKLLKNSSRLRLYYKSEAYYWALVLEAEMLATGKRER
ncbi:hypothetical protein QWY31_08460 [Cytophagales bacterium LB-30]|uniref:DUF3541 domain-containing protein n=1 Tax=Shiella aurantiaca TaxID=3058365 RepID=A0ABT8F557_9BACT|nr:hypothetical protein [Shiella aurantiaca]MDN4165530.1 hypothetical protein [Shiella aurantiaca]